MDFYIDLALTVLLRLVRDRKGIKPWYRALNKLHKALDSLAIADADYQDVRLRG